ncbi:MAG: transposase [Gemmatimonadetes bacterium]|nr:transposase [Gemmatimonadota bacterium]
MQSNAESNKNSTVTERSSGREMRWIADAYEQAQRVRVQTGERIRAVLQARDETWRSAEPAAGDAETMLKQIRSGKSEGPVPLLGRTYRRHWEAEQEMAQAMRQALQDHPAWPWLEQVKGIGPTLAGKLVARLDATRADTPSAFWAYCGLATVPGVEYRCRTCGYTASFPESYRVSGAHTRLGGRGRCSGQIEVSRTEGVRVAQPKPARGQRASYDQYAKKVCYLIGTSFLKSGGAYSDYYRREKAKLEAERPGWATARRHLTALRKTEKLFLSHLWLVWRAALDLPLTQPYAGAQQDPTEITDPWAMVEPAGAAPESGSSPTLVTGDDEGALARPVSRAAAAIRPPSAPPKRISRTRLMP